MPSSTNKKRTVQYRVLEREVSRFNLEIFDSEVGVKNSKWIGINHVPDVYRINIRTGAIFSSYMRVGEEFQFGDVFLREKGTASSEDVDILINNPQCRGFLNIELPIKEVTNA